MRTKSKSTKIDKWDSLIAYAEGKLAKSRIKTAQIEAILAMFRAQAKSGEPCPTDVAGFDDALTKQLQ